MAAGPEVEGSAEEPLNREPDIKTLLSSFLTPVQAQPYDRNHGGIPQLDGETHTLTIDGAVPEPVTFHIHDLVERFQQRTIIAALQCAGNRRHTMRTEMKEVSGIDWGDAAVMNCAWKGVLLRDVIDAVGLDFEKDKVGWEDRRDAAHVQFACYQTETQEDTWYGGSITLQRAMDPEAQVLLATEMNGEPLTPAHGFPLRVVVPGVAGARSVKWLDRITIAAVESTNFYQKHDYKVLPPEATDAESAEKFWHRTPALTEMPINSIIGYPLSGDTLTTDGNGCIEVAGYALPSGNGGPVAKVEVSADEGSTWAEAELDWGGWENKTAGDNTTLKWSWALWRAKLPVVVGSSIKIWSRASDTGGNVQPREGQWTLRGVCYNAYGEAKDLNIRTP